MHQQKSKFSVFRMYMKKKNIQEVDYNQGCRCPVVGLPLIF